MNHFTLSNTPHDEVPVHPMANTTAVNENEIDFFELLNSLLKYKRTIIVVLLASFAIATTIAFILPQKYEAQVLVAPAEEPKGGGLASLAGQLGGLAEMAGVTTGGGGAKEGAIAYLRSRVFIESFIKDKNLLPVLFPKKWDPATNKWKVKTEDIPTLWDGYKYFYKKILSLSVDKKSGLMTLSLEWKDREQVVEWANEMIRRANTDLRQRTITETQLSLLYLEKELHKTSVVEVQQAIYRVMESQVKTMMMANVREQFAFKVIDPAAVVDEDDYVKPNRPLLIALGFFGGLVMGVLVALARRSIDKRKQRLDV